MKPVKRTKQINTSMVIHDLWLNREASRVEIAKRLGLNKSTISHIINELIDSELVHEGLEGEASPQGGRKPVFLSLNKDYGSVFGIEVRPDSFSAVCVDLEGNIRFYRNESRLVNGENLSSTLIDILKELIKEQKKSGIPLLGIGVGLSGVINPKNGIVDFSMPLGIYDKYDFHKEIASHFNVPVFIENDANCCSWGELTFHRNTDLKNFLFVLVEFRNLEGVDSDLEKTAVGLGVVIDGKIHYGKNYSAGEFSSVFRAQDSKGQFNVTSQGGVSIDNDPGFIREFIDELSKNISLLVNSFNISQVFFGGDIEKYQQLVHEALSEEIQQNWPYPNNTECDVRFSSLGEKSVAYGAAGMMLDRLFLHPDFIIRKQAVTYINNFEL